MKFLTHYTHNVSVRRMRGLFRTDFIKKSDPESEPARFLS